MLHLKCSSSSIDAIILNEDIVTEQSHSSNVGLRVEINAKHLHLGLGYILGY